jgi:hypothetical protein
MVTVQSTDVGLAAEQLILPVVLATAPSTWPSSVHHAFSCELASVVPAAEQLLAVTVPL